MVDNFHLINSSKWYHVYKNPTIHIPDMKYDHYGSNTLSRQEQNVQCQIEYSLLTNARFSIWLYTQSDLWDFVFKKIIVLWEIQNI
jgi:hypothetical protein